MTNLSRRRARADVRIPQIAGPWTGRFLGLSPARRRADGRLGGVTATVTPADTATHADAPPLVGPLDSANGRAGLLAAFREALGDDSCLDWSAAARALYASDASIYRVPPTVVARPRDKAELVRVARAALAVGLPVTARGAGTSLSGGALCAGLVIDTGHAMNRIVHLDPEAATAVVEPGVVQQRLQEAAKPFGLRFGPDPNTSDRCTIGGMIGNNACGARALGYGRTADNVLRLEVLTAQGDVVVLGEGADPQAGPLPATRAIALDHLAMIRTEFGRFSRQASGYALEHLLPERGCAFERFFVGTEGTLGIVLEATVRLVHDAPVQTTIVLGYPSMAEAADDMPGLLPFHPTAAEGLDSRIVDLVRRNKGAGAVPRLPRGEGYAIIELVGEDAAEVDARAQSLVAAAHCVEGYVERDPAVAKAVWQMRSDAAGYAGIALDEPGYPSWEDASVPVEKLGTWLREFDRLLAAHGLHAYPYGHFGEGCIHCRIDFPLDSPGGTSVYRAFMLDAADHLAALGGSMSGEHGDGRARSELLPKMYGPEAMRAFADIKRAWDPLNLLNPGMIVDPVPTDADIRVAQTIFSPLNQTDHAFVRAAHTCVGQGKCLADLSPLGKVMCPSYQATGDELYSTRGRGRLLQEMINGSIIHGWDAPELLDTIDLCLACKGCRNDCPSGFDMAAHKSRILFEAYRHKLRPVGHYVLGWLPRWGRLAVAVPGLSGLINLVLATPGLSSLVKRVAGVDGRRPMPAFRAASAKRSGAAALARIDPARLAERPPVAVWVDSFSDTLGGTALPALLQVLLRAGFAPRIVEENACCGLTWITTGQQDGARAQLRRALDVLTPIAAAGVPIVGMEPSCMAVWRSDAPELLPDDPRVAVVAGATKTLAELLGGVSGWQPPSLAGHTIVAQPHCHHASVLGWKADAALLARTGAKVVTVGGCCGLAGNFGVERGHYDISVKVFEHDLGPALEKAGPDAIVLADGFSCRKQVSDLTSRQAMTLAELLASHS